MNGANAALLHDPVFRAFLAGNMAERFASSALSVLLGFQMFALTGNPLDLAWLGLAEAVPGIGLVLHGGDVADRHSRRRIVWVASALMAALAGAVALVATTERGLALPVLLAVGFAAGVVRAFEDPAASGLEAQVVPARLVLPGIALLAVTGRLASVCGPVAGGFAWLLLGPAGTYAAIAALFGVSCVAVLAGVPEQPLPPPAGDLPTTRRIAEGVRYVARDQVLLGSMALDLFAVFFGGATALLPVFATAILHVGPVGFGLLRSASAAGSLASALLAGRFLPPQRAGQVLLGVVAGFGVSMVVFGLSRFLPLSLLALFVAGLCDGTSVVIRRAILRLASPEAMRGRIAAVKSVFVGSSNELGAFESGVAASLLGASAAVWAGGLATLGIVAATAVLAPRLRRLDLLQLAKDGPAATPPQPAPSPAAPGR